MIPGRIKIIWISLHSLCTKQTLRSKIITSRLLSSRSTKHTILIKNLTQQSLNVRPSRVFRYFRQILNNLVEFISVSLPSQSHVLLRWSTSCLTYSTCSIQYSSVDFSSCFVLELSPNFKNRVYNILYERFYESLTFSFLFVVVVTNISD